MLERVAVKTHASNAFCQVTLFCQSFKTTLHDSDGTHSMHKIGYSINCRFTDAHYVARTVLCRTDMSYYQGRAITGLGMAPDGHWRLNSINVVRQNMFLYLPSHHPTLCRENCKWDILKPCSLLLPLLCFHEVQTLWTLANSFQISVKCLIAMVTPGGTGESCRFSQSQNKRLNIDRGTTHLGSLGKKC